MVDISLVPPDAGPILLMVGVAPDIGGVAPGGSLFSDVAHGGRGHGRVLSLFTKDYFPLSCFLFLFLLTMNSNSTILCLKYIICIPMLSKKTFSFLRHNSFSFWSHKLI